MPTNTTTGALAISAAALLAGACNTTEGAPAAGMAESGRQCFLASQVNGFHAVDSDTVHVDVGTNTVYELQLSGTCPDVDWEQRIAIRSTSGGSWVCRGYDAELLVPSPTGIDRCQVLDVRQLSPAEVDALRASRG